jgi:allophanate hydrolase subunit 2
MFGGILYITDTIKYNFDNNKNMTSITITTSYTYKEYSKIILAETTTTTYKVKAIVNKQGVKLDKQSLDKINKQQKQNVQGVFNLIKDRIK